MANQRLPRLSPSRLQEAPPPPAARFPRWPMVLAIVAGLLVLAWFEGGERSLRPIAQDVTLPALSGAHGR